MGVSCKSRGAAEQGLRLGDRIVRVNAQPATREALAEVQSWLAIGTQVRFLVQRDMKPVVVWVRAGVAPD